MTDEEREEIARTEADRDGDELRDEARERAGEARRALEREGVQLPLRIERL